MFDIGAMEVMAVLLVMLLVLGPKQLPQVTRIIGRKLTQLKKIKQQLQKELSDSDPDPMPSQKSENISQKENQQQHKHE